MLERHKRHSAFMGSSVQVFHFHAFCPIPSHPSSLHSVTFLPFRFSDSRLSIAYINISAWGGPFNKKNYGARLGYWSCPLFLRLFHHECLYWETVTWLLKLQPILFISSQVRSRVLFKEEKFFSCQSSFTHTATCFKSLRLLRFSC